MRRYFNVQSQVLVLLLLAAFEVVQIFFKPSGAWWVMVDVACVFSILQLVGSYTFYLLRNARRLRVLLAQWAADAHAHRVITIVRETLTWVTVLFLCLWLSRWLKGLDAGWTLRGAGHYEAYLDAALITMLVSWLLSWRRVVRWLARVDFNSGRRMLLLYAVALTAGSFLLIFPFSLQDGQSLKLVDAFFTTASALSVTGLSTINVASVLSLPGQFILLVLIQIGGLGIIILTAALALTTLKRLSLSAALVGKELYDIPDIGNMPLFLGKVMSFTLVAELIGAVVLYANLPAELPNRLFHALFHAVSAFCNAGFSTLPANLEASPFTVLGLGTICTLIFVGGLGFPAIFELLAGGGGPSSGRWRRLSANSRLSLMVSFLLLTGGAAAIYLLESLAPYPFLQPTMRAGQALFYSVSARTAGFGMVPLVEFGQTTVLVIMALMVVGGAPLSTAGGIKTSSLGVLVATAFSTLKGLQWVQFDRREIPFPTVQRAVTALVLYAGMAGVATLLLIFTEDIDAWRLIFEVISALSTVGLSLNVTESLSVTGKLIVASLMMLGRLGIATVVYAGLGRRSMQRFRYPQDKFFTG